METAALDIIQEESQKKFLTTQSYTVDALVEKLGVSANSKIWKSIDAIVCIQGVIGKIKPYRHVVYFDLKGSNSTVKVKCPIEFQPQEGLIMVIEGVPFFKPSSFNTGLEIIIEGKPIGIIEPPKQDIESPQIDLLKKSYIKLNDYLRENWITDFCLVGTETAIRDVLSQVSHHIKNAIHTHIIRVYDSTIMLSDLDKVLPHFESFAIVRGGNDDSLKIWNDPYLIKRLLMLEKPFYVALGHTHVITLSDQFADESFHTPTALGLSLTAILKRIMYENSLEEKIVKLNNENNRFEAQIKYKLKLYKSRSTISIISILLCFIIYIFFDLV